MAYYPGTGSAIWLTTSSFCEVSASRTLEAQTLSHEASPECRYWSLLVAFGWHGDVQWLIEVSDSTYGLHCSCFFGLTKYTLRILKGSPKKELHWRLRAHRRSSGRRSHSLGSELGSRVKLRYATTIEARARPAPTAPSNIKPRCPTSQTPEFWIQDRFLGMFMTADAHANRPPLKEPSFKDFFKHLG